MKNKIFPHLALLVVAIIYGLNFVIAKNVMTGGYLSPFPFILIRVGGGVIIFWFLYLVLIRETIKWSDLPYLIMCAILGVAINQLAFFAGLNLTTPVHASLLMTLVPVLVLIASAILLKERIRARKIIGVFLGICGAIYLISSGEDVFFNGSIIQGDLMVLINVVSYSLYLVLIKRLLIKYHPLTVITWLFTIGFILVFPFGIVELGDAEWATFGFDIWFSILYVIIGTTFLAYLLNTYAISKVEPSTVSIYIYLQPLIASIASYYVYSETWGIEKLASGLLIFMGVYFVSFPNIRPKKIHLKE